MSADEIEKLRRDRQNDRDVIAGIERILSTSSYAARTEAYCRFSVEQTRRQEITGMISEDEMEREYAELLRSEPPTREEELQRQQHLQVLHYWITQFEAAVNQCEGIFTNGPGQMLSGDQLRQEAAKARHELEEIERKLGSVN